MNTVRVNLATVCFMTDLILHLELSPSSKEQAFWCCYQTYPIFLDLISMIQSSL